MKTIIKDILEEKGKKVFLVESDSTVYKAITLMVNNKIGALLVMKDKKPVGIFTERDYLSKIVLQGFSSKKTKVKQSMTEKIICVKPENTVEEGLAIMTEKRCRHLPVCQNNEIDGIVSIGDLVKSVIKNQNSTIDYLEDYIQNTW